jgi:hypothetical protein
MDWERGFSHFPFERNYFFFSGSGGRFPQYGTLTGTIFHFSNKNERGILFVRTLAVNIRHKRGNVGSTDTDLSLSAWIRNQLDVTFMLSFISLLQVSQHVSGNHVPIFRN